jgi:hypothetical protein
MKAPSSAPTASRPRRVPATPEPRADPGRDAEVDPDRAGRVARPRRTTADIDRVRLLARTHAGDPDWAEVVALLDRLGLVLGRDHGSPSAPR